LDQVTLKTCSCCKRELPVGAFWRRKASRDGLFASCIACVRSSRKKRSASQEHRLWRKSYEAIKRGETLLRSRGYWQIQYQLSRGRLTRPTVCPECDRETFVVATFEDPKAWYAYRWMCRRCLAHRIYGHDRD